MRRRAGIAAAAAGLILLGAGCGGGKEASPLPVTVEGSLPQQQAGDATAGKAVFMSSGCGACHTLMAAGTNGKVGPDLDHVAADAKKANQGPVADYVHTSITDPGAYVVAGFPNGVMPAFTSLSPTDLANLVAFVTQSAKG